MQSESCNPIPTQTMNLLQFETVDHVQSVLDSIRRSYRTIKLPVYLHDYHSKLKTNVAASSASCITSHPILEYLSYDRLSSTYKSFIFNISSTYKPQTFHQDAQLDH